MKLVLDAHYSPLIARQLRERGYDVVAALESYELRELPNEDLLRWAQRERRVLVTGNVRDFMVLHHSFLNRREIHAGMLLTSPRTFPRRLDAVGHLIAALEVFMADQLNVDALEGNAVWLRGYFPVLVRPPASDLYRPRWMMVGTERSIPFTTHRAEVRQTSGGIGAEVRCGTDMRRALSAIDCERKSEDTKPSRRSTS